MYSCLDIPANWMALAKEEQEKDQEAQDKIALAETRFSEIVEQHPEHSITFSYSGGKLVDEIIKCINEREIDFLIMGSHGTSGVSEIIIGSNTQKVVRLVHCPVLITKGPVEDVNFKKIVFASNFNLDQKPVFLKFKEIVAPFEPEIHLLGVKTSFFFDAPVDVLKSAMEDFKKLAAPFPTKIYVFKNSNIESSIRFFSEDIGADLIAISNNNRRPIKRMLAGSNVEALINHSDLSILSIDFKE